MKVLLINGSPRENGNTAHVLSEMVRVFSSEGIDSEIVNVGAEGVSGCLGCGGCYDSGECVIDDIVNETLPKFAECDALVVGSPVHYAAPSGSVMSFLQRLFYCSGNIDTRMKVGAAVVCARRGGTTAAFNELNNFFTISQMPIASGDYWNNVFGRTEGECVNDEEGMRNARVVARNVIFLMRAIADAKQKYGLPEEEERKITNFIR